MWYTIANKGQTLPHIRLRHSVALIRCRSRPLRRKNNGRTAAAPPLRQPVSGSRAPAQKAWVGGSDEGLLTGHGLMVPNGEQCRGVLMRRVTALWGLILAQWLYLPIVGV